MRRTECIHAQSVRIWLSNRARNGSVVDSLNLWQVAPVKTIPSRYVAMAMRLVSRVGAQDHDSILAARSDLAGVWLART